VSAFAEQHNAGDDVAIVNYFALLVMDRLAQLSEPDFGALCNKPHVPDAHRSPVLHLQHGRPDVFGALHQSHRPHVDRLRAALNEASTGVGVLLASACSTWAMLRP